jgi:hypothetical protein
MYWLVEQCDALHLSIGMATWLPVSFLTILLLIVNDVLYMYSYMYVYLCLLSLMFALDRCNSVVGGKLCKSFLPADDESGATCRQGHPRNSAQNKLEYWFNASFKTNTVTLVQLNM